MKLFILGLDGLEYDIAVDLNLKDVLQKHYGKLEVPIDEKVGCPMSPEVWASFLCAEHVNIGFEGKKNMWAFNLLRSLKRIFPFISFGIGKKVLGSNEGFKQLDRKTWIDNPNVEEIGVPYYSYEEEAFKHGLEFEQTQDLATYRRELYWLYLKQTKEVASKTKAILNNRKKNIDILFAYIHYPDLFHHAWFTEKDKMKKYYFEINEFVRHMKGLLEEDTHFLIVSDHGFDFTKNEHSDFGFISSNKKMKLPKTIIDLGKQVKAISEENKG